MRERRNIGRRETRRRLIRRETGNGELGRRETGNGELGRRETGNGELGRRETGNGEIGRREIETERYIYLVVIVPLNFFLSQLRVQVPTTRHPWMGQNDRQFCYTAKTPHG